MHAISRRTGAKLAALIALSSLCLLDAPAIAGTATSNLTVTATVSANCTISTSPVAFGAYDPVSANASSPLNGTGGLTVSCTTGSGAILTLNQGSSAAGGSSDAIPLRQMSDGGISRLAYAMYQDAPRTTVWGNTGGTGAAHMGTGSATSITIYGQVPAAQNVPAGSYSDTVVATITF